MRCGLVNRPARLSPTVRHLRGRRHDTSTKEDSSTPASQDDSTPSILRRPLLPLPLLLLTTSSLFAVYTPTPAHEKALTRRHAALAALRTTALTLTVATQRFVLPLTRAVWDAKTPGLMNGSHDYTGNFEGCLTPDANRAPRKYCVFDVTLTYKDGVLTQCNQDAWLGHISCPHNRSTITNFILKWALCTVCSCSEPDLRTMAEHLVQKSDIGRARLAFKISLPKNSCQTSVKHSFGTNDIIFFCLIGTIAAIVIICTIWHWGHGLTSHKPGVKAPALVRNWSIIDNFASLMETSSDEIRLFHSLRVITMYILIAVHQILFAMKGPVANLDYFLSLFQVIGRFRIDLLVDSCFTMGSFLTTYNFFTSKDKNLFDLALTRYFRFLPMLALIFFYVTSVMEYTGHGPFWPIIAGMERDTCTKYWWLGLLMLGNYGPWEEHCWIVSWYIPADYHFYLVGIVLCRLIKKNAKLGLSALSALLVTSILHVGCTIGYNDWIISTPLMTDGMRDLRSLNALEQLYIRSHFRISSYLVGMLGGYISYVWTQKKMVISKPTAILGFLSSLMILVLTFTSGLFIGSHIAVIAALYGAVLRPMWSLGLVLFILTFMFGKMYFPKTASLFEMKMWIPLSKLTFCMYLMHMAFIYRTIGMQVQPLLFDRSVMVIRIVVDLALTLVGALVLYLCVEKPSYGLFKLTLNKYRTWRKPKVE